MDGGIQSSRLPTPEGRWRFYVSGRTKERGRDVSRKKGIQKFIKFGFCSELISSKTRNNISFPFVKNISLLFITLFRKKKNPKIILYLSALKLYISRSMFKNYTSTGFLFEKKLQTILCLCL